MKSGILLIDKPVGMSSAFMLNKIKRNLGIKKLGHSGTLDPMASGLLVSFVADATKAAPYSQSGAKRYSGRIRWGLTTTSDDVTGNPLTQSEVRPSYKDILVAAQRYVGNISQIPPQVSAIKVGGQHAYDRARRGQHTELASRQVEVTRFQIEPLSEDEVQFIVDCSTGTYIRSLARDLGADLGCGACLSALRREAVAPFDVSLAKGHDQIQYGDILDVSILFPGVPTVELEPIDVAALHLGNERWLTKLERAGVFEHCASAPLVLYRAHGSTRSAGLLDRSSGPWRFAFVLRS